MNLLLISKLRFKVEPTGLRGVVQSGMLNANKDWSIAINRDTGTVYVRYQDKWLRSFHETDCAWVEYADGSWFEFPSPLPQKAAPKDTGVIITDAKALPKK